MAVILRRGVGLQPHESTGAGQHQRPSPAAPFPGSARCAGAAPGPFEGQNEHSSSLCFGIDSRNNSLSSALLAKPWVTLSVTCYNKSKHCRFLYGSL